jgi:intein/homing endonuclease
MCEFCTVRNFYNTPYQEREIPDIIYDFDTLHNLGIKHIKIMDELFIFRPERVKEICNALIERQYNFNIWAYARVDIMNNELLSIMKKAGINWLAYGFECLDPETFILTRDGIKKIDNVFIGDEIYSYNNGKFEFHKVLNKLSKIKQSILLKSEVEEIICSKEHKLYFLNDDNEIKEIESKNIKKGDILLGSNRNGINFDNEFITPTLSKLIGFILGDGYISKNVIKITSHINEKYLLEEYAQIANNNLKVNTTIYISKQDNNPTLYITGKNTIMKLIMDLGLYGTKSRTKFIPKEILSSNNLVIANCIGGLWDSDGNISYSKKNYSGFNCSISLNNLYLIKQIKFLLLYHFGIETSNIKKRVDKRYVNEEKCQYVIYIRRIESLRKFREFIPLLHKNKKENLNNYLKDNIKVKSSSYVYIPKSVLEDFIKLNKWKIRKLDKSFGNIRNVLYSHFNTNKLISFNKLNGFIKSVESKKANSNENIRKYIKLIKNGLRFIKIVSVEELKEQTVVDLTIDKTHNYIANGFITHNSGSDSIRKNVLKGNFTNDKIREVTRMTKDNGINVLGNFMFGFWEDNLDTMQETLELAKGLNCEYNNLYCVTAYPGTKMYEELKTQNVDLPTSYAQYAQMSREFKPLPTKHLKGKEVLKFRDEAFLTLHTSAKYLLNIKQRFGERAVNEVLDMCNIKLKRS